VTASPASFLATRRGRLTLLRARCSSSTSSIPRDWPTSPRPRQPRAARQRIVGRSPL